MSSESLSYSAMPASQRFSFRAVITPGLTTVRRHWRPFLLLQGAALLLIVGYYWVPAVTRACVRVAEYRAHAGLIFSAIAAGLAGSVLPDLAKRIVRRDYRIDRRDVRDLVFTFSAFGFSGVFTDVQYHGFAWLYGDGHDAATVIKKVLTDQFVTTPVYGTPYWVVVYLWRRERYHPLATIRRLRPRWYLSDVAPLLVTGWAFWIPMCSLIYSLPTALQFLLFCFSLAGWSLLMVFIAGDPEPVPSVIQTS
jgi:hypothetical protein